MDKHLKDINFDEQIKMNFSEEEKKTIFKKIDVMDNKKLTKRYLFPNLLTAIVVIGMLFYGFNFFSHQWVNTDQHSNESQMQGPNDKEKDAMIGNDEDDDNKEPLIIGANIKRNLNPALYLSYDYSDSNSNLFMAHLSVAMITENGVHVRGRITNQYYSEFLEDTYTYLSEIITNGEKEKELQTAINLTNKAIISNVEIGDPILDEIHLIVHELDEYFNENPFTDHKTTEFGLDLPPEDLEIWGK